MIFPDENEKKLRNKIAASFSRCLKKSPEAIEYLKERGFYDPSLIEQFKIGWCPSKAKQINGITVDLSGRVIFPIVDEFGDVIAFTGRLTKSKKEISSYEKRWIHESFAKEFFTYGMNVALNNIIKKNFVVVVEGQVDVLACNRYGFNNTIGLLGGDMSDHTRHFLKSLTNNFVLLMDGDAAGRKNANKIKEKLEKNESEFKKQYKKDGFIIDIDLSRFGSNCDPDLFFSKAKEKGKKYIIEQLKNRGR